MLRRRLVPALALAAILAGCSSSEPFVPSGFQPRPSPQTTAPQTTASPAASASPSPSRIGPAVTARPTESGHGHEPGYTPDDPPSEDFREPDVDGGGQGTLRLLVRIKPGCVEPGQLITFTLKTKPDVSLLIIPNVAADEQGRAKEYSGRTGADGLWSQTISIPPNHVARESELFASAADDKGYDGGHSGTWRFVIAEKGECR